MLPSLIIFFLIFRLLLRPHKFVVVSCVCVCVPFPFPSILFSFVLSFSCGVCLSFLFSGTLTYANHNRSQTAGLLLLVRFLAESPMVLCWVQCATGSGLNLFLSRFGIIGRLLWLEWAPLLVAAIWEVLHGKSTFLIRTTEQIIVCRDWRVINSCFLRNDERSDATAKRQTGGVLRSCATFNTCF